MVYSPSLGNSTSSPLASPVWAGANVSYHDEGRTAMALKKAVKRKYRPKSSNKSYYGSHLLYLLTTFGVQATIHHYPDVDLDEALRALQQEFDKKYYGGPNNDDK